MPVENEFREIAWEPTRWSEIELAGQSTPEGRAARARLLPKMYPLVLKVFRARNAKNAHDGTQEFFAADDLLTGRLFRLADRRKGPFRYYLAGAARNKAADLSEKERALKRGGRATFVPIDDPQQCPQLADARPSPEKSYEVECELRALAVAYKKLKSKYDRRGDGPLFAALWESCATPNYEEMGLRLGKIPSTVRTELSRFRKKVREFYDNELRRLGIAPHGHPNGELP